MSDNKRTAVEIAAEELRRQALKDATSEATRNAVGKFVTEVERTGRKSDENFIKQTIQKRKK